MNPKSKIKSASRPFVLVNVAMTADGKIAAANHAPLIFSSRRDREHMLELRATVDAVMSGARTVDSAPVTLGTGAARFRRLRLRRGLAQYHLRIIVSGSGTVNPRATIFQRRFSPIMVLTTGRASSAKLRRLRAEADEVKVFGGREINFRSALRWLRARWGVRRLLCEGGGELNDALFRAGLVDELHLTICPTIFGGRCAPTLADGAGFRRLGRAAPFRIKSFKRVGDEVFAVFRRMRRP